MKNAEIAAMFETMADIMEIQGENTFRVGSYRRVARILNDMTEDVAKVARDGKLAEIEGIGESSAAKIMQFIETGRIEAYDRLVANFPTGALELLKIPGLGPKTVGKLMEMGIESLDELDAAIASSKLSGVTGVGDKTIENIRKGIAFVRSRKGRTLLGDAWPLAQEIVEKLAKSASLKAIEPAGSLRRMKETIGDIDILATVASPKGRGGAKKGGMPDGKEVVKAFCALDVVKEVLATGDTKGSVRTHTGLQVDLRVVPTESFGAALVYFTGSKAHNIKIRSLAQTRNLKINEYGVFKGKKLVAGKTEEDVYKAIGLPWIPPELREDRGEVEAAVEGKLPALVELDDIRGEMHAHTSYSDGSLSVLEMAQSAKKAGYRYLALTDHSKNLGVARGLDEKTLAKRNEEIDRVNEQLKNFTILKGAEVDILRDGSLDYHDGTLASLDWVVASVHDHFAQSEKEMTERIIRAVRNPHVHAIGHLTGRLIGQREAYMVDVPAVVRACAETGTLLELNAHPDRLDITDVVCREAKEAGVKVVIGTDAHHFSHYRFMRFGVATARRGWLEKSDVVNCMTLAQLLKHLKSMKH
jgi:DNA polymerase (family 10)